MIPFPERHVAAFRTLQTVWDSRRFIVIGAAAIARHLDFRWRGTIDLDLSVASGLDAFVRDLEDRLSTLPRMAERAPAAWKNAARLRLRLLAFRRGFESQPG